jgi:hypothetical protein
MRIAAGPDRAGSAAPLLERAIGIYRELGLDHLVTEAADDLARLQGRTPDGQHATDLRALSLTREGDVYAVKFDGALFRVRNSKGMRYLALLVERAGQPMHALDLMCADGGIEPTALAGSDAGPVLDEMARQKYRARLAGLAEDLEEAERFADEGRADRLRTEIDALVEELGRATGLGGRARRAGSAPERARVNVQRRLRSAVDALAHHHRPLGEHLEKALRTGAFCIYQP